MPHGKNESLRVVATIQNHGGTPAEFSIKFPDETGDIEATVDHSNRSTARKTKSNIHKQLFDIKPRKF